ncbi:hypothetical protein F2Q69_00030775 [Brassica cretica]|uniref:Uncharacterized protein n=1 Tax=Brassica cretica TaxID=69181 RepID=A0A8S9RY06_BRACR|nr:hypothetical protein F2Q69_00030775 [Brassica cretica]
MVRGDALVRSSDLRTSVSWLNDKVKGIRKLRLNQDELGTAEGQLNSARWSVMVRASVVGSWAVMGSGQLGVAFSINRESLVQKMARKSLGKTLPKSYQKERNKESKGPAVREENRGCWCGLAGEI